MQTNIRFSLKREDIDVDFVTDFLASQAYWSKGRSREAVVLSIEHSMCFCVFIGKVQIGFARVVTDYVTFAYVMDVFIDPNHQSKGYGKQLMQFLLGAKPLAGIKHFSLRTEDAVGFYQSLGFVKTSQEMMRLEVK